MRKTQMKNAHIPAYNRFIDLFGEKLNKSVDEKRVKLEKEIEALKAQLEPINAEWEKTKV